MSRLIILKPAVVGIVPSSVGATFLYEWMADSFPLDDIDQTGNINTLRSLESIGDVSETTSAHHPPYKIDAEHGFLVPMHLCFDPSETGWPVASVPIAVNVLQHPLPTARRCWRL